MSRTRSKRRYDGLVTLYLGQNGATQMEEFACCGRMDLGEVIIADSVTLIGKGAFQGCGNLMVVRFPRALAAIGACAFHGCESLLALDFPDGLTSIGAYAFFKCYRVTTLPLPAGLTSIGERAFLECEGITSLVLPERLAHLGEFAFQWCSGLNTVEIPDGLATLNHGTFRECGGLTAVCLPAGLTRMGAGVFCNCKCLTAVHLPRRLATMPSGVFSDFCHEPAFSSCRSLARVIAPDHLVHSKQTNGMNNSLFGYEFTGCPVLQGAGLTPSSQVKLQRRDFWHSSMHQWCRAQAKECVLTFLLAELRFEAQRQADELLPLDHEVWLLVLEFVPRHAFGPP